MIKIILEIADNGIIKTIIDDNSNGAGSQLEKKKVYDFEDDFLHRKKIKFFYELAEELDIDTGNSFNNNNLIMTCDWGENYIPTGEEVELKIKKLKTEINLLKLKYLNSNRDKISTEEEYENN